MPADGLADGETRDAIRAVLLEDDGQPVADVFRRILEKLGPVGEGAARSHAERLPMRRDAPPDHRAAVPPGAFVEPDNLKLLLHEILVFLQIPGTIAHPVDPVAIPHHGALMPRHEELPVVCHDLVQGVALVRGQDLEDFVVRERHVTHPRLEPRVRFIQDDHIKDVVPHRPDRSGLVRQPA